MDRSSGDNPDSPEDVKKIPKADRPDMAQIHQRDLERTQAMNPTQESQPVTGPPASRDIPQSLESSSGLPVSIKGEMRYIKRENVADDKGIKLLFDTLQLSDEATGDTHLSETQRLIDQIIAAIDDQSINRDILKVVLTEIREGQRPDWGKWDELERFQLAVQPIIDVCTSTELHERPADTFISWYFQNLKDKGIDYEQLMDTFVNNNPYGLTLSESLAIFSYTSILFYEKLNKMLREGTDVEKTQPLVALIESGLAKLPSETVTQYRGLDLVKPEDQAAFLAEHQAQSTVIEPQFLSAANHPLRPFWDYNVRLLIRPANGLLIDAHTITDLAFGTHFIETLSQGKRQNDTHESLFPTKSKFTVASVIMTHEIDQESGKARHIHVIILEPTK